MIYRLFRAGSIRISVVAALTWLTATGTGWSYDLTPPWPNGRELAQFRSEPVSFPSHSPFALNDIAGADEVTTAQGLLFMPEVEEALAPFPAIVMLHGAGGIMEARELTYGRQFAAMGVAALVIDVFGARRDLASSFTERLLNITETMFLADAYAGLEFLASMPEVDGGRIALIGFSYGGMAATYAAHEQVAVAFAPEDRGFAAQVAFYAPCIVTFDSPEPSGAPLLMLYGDRDEIIDIERCEDTRDALRNRGGDVQSVMFEGAFHQWDGWSSGGRRLSRGLADCNLRVEDDLDVRDARTGMPMSAVWNRTLILGLCVDDEGYVIKRDDAIRARSNAVLADFLTRSFDAAVDGG